MLKFQFQFLFQLTNISLPVVNQGNDRRPWRMNPTRTAAARDRGWTGRYHRDLVGKARAAGRR